MIGRVTLEALRVIRSAVGLAGFFLAACDRRDAGSDWTLQVDTVQTSAASGNRVTASLRASGKEGPEGGAATHPVALSLDCFGDNATVAIMTDQALRQGSTDVRMSVDGGPSRKVKGFAGTTKTGGKVLLQIAQDSLLARLSGHWHAVLHYADGAGSYKTTAEFPIAGLVRQEAAFLAACGRRGGKR